MLIGNITLLSRNPGRFAGGTTQCERSNFNKSGSYRNFFSHRNPSMTASFVDKSSFPNGYVPPYTWVIPQSSGGMAIYNGINGSGLLSPGTMSAGMNISVRSDSLGMVGNGGISSAGLALIVQGVSNILGSGTLNSSIIGKLEATVSMSGSGDIQGSLGALASAVCEIVSTSSMSNDINAYANISADISPFTDLSPENLAASVWNTIANNYNNPGTMGYQINIDMWERNISNIGGTGSAAKLIRDLEILIKQVKALSAAGL